MRGKTPSVGIVNQWGSPAASSVSTSSGGNSDLRFLNGMEGKFCYIPTFCSKVCRILRYPLVNKTHSRIHFILERKLNIVRILKELCQLNWGNHVYSVSSAKTAPLVLGAGSGTRKAESGASLEMGHRAVASRFLLGLRDVVGGHGTR